VIFIIYYNFTEAFLEECLEGDLSDIFSNNGQYAAFSSFPLPDPSVPFMYPALI
jgi:hypothetical protein